MKSTVKSHKRTGVQNRLQAIVPKSNHTKRSKNPLVFIGFIATFVGLLGFVPSMYFWYKNEQSTHALARSNEPAITAPTVISAPQVITGKPTVLTIPSLNLQLPIDDGIMNPKTGQWTLSNDNVHYALATVQPNDQAGNTLVYGHYRPGVFLTLHKIQPNSLVTIRSENNYIFTYKYMDNKIVSPSDGSIFAYEGAPILTLQTCTGAFMQNRQLFRFAFVSVQKTV